MMTVVFYFRFGLSKNISIPNFIYTFTVGNKKSIDPDNRKLNSIM